MPEHERKSSDPLFLPLRIFALDPSAPGRDGAIATVNVPYEPLGAGPIAAMFKFVDDSLGELAPLDLDSASALIDQGYRPHA